MRDHWRRTSIEEIITGLYDGPHATPKPSDFGPVFFGIKNLTDDGRLDLSDIRHIAEDDFPKWTKRVLPQEDDIVFTYEATLHRYGLIPKGLRCCLGRRMALIRVDQSKADPKFLLYYFQSSEWRQTIESNLLIGATVNRIPIGDFPKFPLRIPPLKEQKEISNILSALDSKIELNNRINAELEALAKTIYDYWFVQFDFPISKELATQMGKPELEGRPYKSSGGKMVYNKELKREVPEGWEVKYVEEILVKQKAPKKIPTSDYLENGKVPIIDQSRDFICGYTNDLNAKIIADTPQIVFGDHTRILKLINFDFARGADGTQVLQSGEEKVPQHYFFHALSKIDLSNYGYARHFKFLKQSKVLVPALEIVNSFEKMVTPFFEKIRHSIFENRELASLRDWLLPMLMNGQVKVGEAKEYVQEEKLDRDQVGMAAENREEYGKLAIPANKAAFAKQVLGGKIVSLFKDDPHFTHIKFQKLQYLAEQIAEADLNWNYYRQAAGPYDPRFMHSVALKLKRSKWFAEKDYRYYSLEKVDQVDKYYLGYFGPKQGILQNLFDKLYNFTEDESEIIATLYAVWNNRILDQLEISDDLLISDFREWSSRKLRYSDEQLLQGLEWMNKTGFVPRGFGYKIKEKKVN